MLPSRCIVMASGASMLEGVYEGLFYYLHNKEVTFSINDNIKFFNPTVSVVGDWTAYRDRYKFFSKHPLVISRYDLHFGKTIEGATYCPKHDELILLKSSGKYQGAEGLTNGLYSAVLTGAFTLSLAIQLGFKEIYLLGFDNCEVNGFTHWYQNVKDAGHYTDYQGEPYTGVGKYPSGEYKTPFYNHDDEKINSLWKPFEEEFNNVQIYNVSLPSRITVFPKIGYHSLIKILKENPIQINQDEIRKEIKQLLKPYNKAN